MPWQWGKTRRTLKSTSLIRLKFAETKDGLCSLTGSYTLFLASSKERNTQPNTLGWNEKQLHVLNLLNGTSESPNLYLKCHRTLWKLALKNRAPSLAELLTGEKEKIGITDCWSHIQCWASLQVCFFSLVSVMLEDVPSWDRLMVSLWGLIFWLSYWVLLEIL